jgi:hypothetical protein
MAEDLALDDPEVEYTPESDAPPPAAGGSFGSGRTVLALWLPTPSRRRLIDADLDIVEDAGDNPSLILASTRGPAARRSSIRTLAASAPVVVVCHPGGEAIAAEMVALGACAVVAEGSEGAAVRVLDGESSTHLVEAYLSEVDRSGAGGSTVSFDPVTGLPGSSGFDLRLTELGKDGGMPRLGLIDLGLDIVLRQIGRSGHAAMKRRLSVAIAGAAGSRAAEMFDLGPMLAILAGSMPSPVAHALGAEILDIGATFAQMASRSRWLSAGPVPKPLRTPTPSGSWPDERSSWLEPVSRNWPTPMNSASTRPPPSSSTPSTVSQMPSTHSTAAVITACVSPTMPPLSPGSCSWTRAKWPRSAWGGLSLAQLMTRSGRAAGGRVGSRPPYPASG